MEGSTECSGCRELDIQLPLHGGTVGEYMVIRVAVSRAIPTLHFIYADSHDRYFKSKFHCFDAIVIVAGFVVDVCLKNTLEEVASLVVVLRLWRVFKVCDHHRRIETGERRMKSDLQITRLSRNSVPALKSEWMRLQSVLINWTRRTRSSKRNLMPSR